ncbi:efflux RND transporter periplasmic adaptor subunit [Brevundimonas sp.]|uniref:efflux RND transporter periplasmic adaptor subunit n=1 Tax=Brevundimonas sp. TaxID=1871086 RepID=UPI002487D9C4|nr:efflux RND transporter periplasmic adaptor subunit [Brevundimonas sp.]MDI1281850.1 efflux RND transporter periplasmic adaptor subunit [Brevundimonas sp.]
MANSNSILRAGLMVAVVLGLAACGGDKKAETDAKAGGGASSQTVTVATATLQTVDRMVTASGTISAWEEVPVGAETGGLVATGVYVDEGAWVRQGQVLVKLNDAVLRAQLRQQDAAVSSAEANAAREEADLGRAHELKDRGFLSQASLDMAVAEQRAAEAQLASARAGRSETATRLAQTEIRAPVAGRVISRNVTRGQIVQAGNELFRLVRDGRLELDAQIPETELGLVRAGQMATISSDQIGQVGGRVRIVTPEVNSESRIGVARIALASTEGFRTGMYARAEINIGAQPAVTVPTAAVLYRENRAGVFILSADSHARFQPVTVLSRADDRTSVSGLEAGTRVVVDGAGFLGDGDRVTVAAASPPPAARPATAAAK